MFGILMLFIPRLIFEYFQIACAIIRVLQIVFVVKLENVTARMDGVVQNVTNVQLDGLVQIVINVQLDGLGEIVTNVTQATMDLHIVEVSNY